jgi:hypothetical protein
MESGTSPEHRALVQELMRLGWYRVGSWPAEADGRTIWRFRHGHSLDDERGKEKRVRAATEVGAMRALLAHLGQRAASSREHATDST